MQVIKKTSDHPLATVFIARSDSGRLLEFVESIQPPSGIEDKWVLIVSTLYGCPVNCTFCDAGGKYQGKPGKEEILFQIDHPVSLRFPDGTIRTRKFKVQFSRMGEPSFNNSVLDVLEEIPRRYNYAQFVPSLSTIAPVGTERFFNQLLAIKDSLFRDTFQLQFSVHSTEKGQRDSMIPVKKWDFRQIAAYGEKFFHPSGKKITLNFALSTRTILDVNILEKYFSPDLFLVKLTPVNPTFRAMDNRIESAISKDSLYPPVADDLVGAGYEVILSVGEWEENAIGSNCGQYINQYLQRCHKIPESYSPEIINM